MSKKGIILSLSLGEIVRIKSYLMRRSHSNEFEFSKLLEMI